MHPRFLKSILLISALFLTTGCATTKIFSERDPALPERSIGAILIESQVEDLGLSQASEQSLRDALKLQGYEAYAAADLYFSQRRYSESEVQATLDKKQIEAILIVSEAGSGLNSVYIPPKTTTHTQEVETDDGVKTHTETTVTGDYEETRPWSAFGAQLYDRASGELVWYAEARSESQYGNHDWERLAKITAKKFAGKLIADAVLRRPEASSSTTLATGEESETVKSFRALNSAKN